jgi:hypothetical protein
VEFYLLSTEAAQVKADKTRTDGFFLIVDSPQILGATGTLPARNRHGPLARSLAAANQPVLL